MRIVYLTPVGIMGGAEQCLLNVMASVRAADARCEIHMVAAADGPLVTHAREAGVQTHVLKMPPVMAELGNSILDRRRQVPALLNLVERTASALPQARHYLAELRRTVQSLNPDVIHTNGLKAHLMMSAVGVNRAAMVWHIHDFLGARPAMGRALRLAARRAAGAIAISQAVARDTLEVLPRTPVEVVYNAINVKQFTPALPGESTGDELDRLANLPLAAPGTLRVGLVATYAKWKGQELLLEAARQCYASGACKAVRFFIVGGPIYQTQGSQFSEQELRRRAVTLGIADRVGFIGFQRDTAAIYRALDVVVHASTQPEPFGLTIVEAMACGRPVIVSNAGGAAELFTADQDAIGVPPGDVNALAAAIGRLMTDSALRTRLGLAARATAVRRFSRDRLGGEILTVYNRFRRGR